MAQKQVLIIGAGASGMMAAIAAARAGASVTLLEGMKKPGRKLLLTGNGKCNLTNLSPSLPGAYRSLGSDASAAALSATLAENILCSFGVRETLSFFEELGLATRAIDGLVYPRSGQAQTVLTVLLRELDRLRVKQKFNSKVSAISFDSISHKWHAAVDGWDYEADAVVLCCGSKAAPSTGSDGSGYLLAKMAHHPVTPVFPALTGLVCADHAVKKCAGARTRARVRLLDTSFAADTSVATSLTAAAAGDAADAVPHSAAGSADAVSATATQTAATPASAKPSVPLTLAEDTGEVQWTEYGISGIVVFQLSRFALGLENGRTLTASIDLVPDLTEEEVAASLSRILHHADGRITAKQLLESFTNDRVAAYLAERLPAAATASPAQLAALLKDVRLTVTGVRSFEHAQVSAGGVNLDYVNPKTLESHLAPGLFFAGELLDIDGPCGGYNLQWAWSSGYVAGRSAAVPFQPPVS